MSLLAELGAWLVLAKTLYNAGRMVTVGIWRNQPVRAHQSGEDGILVLFPLYREASIAPHVFRTAANLVAEESGRVQVVLVCTARERGSPAPTTYDNLLAVAAGAVPPGVEIVETDGHDRFKADQLTFGLAHARASGLLGRWPRYWVGVFDADSAPEPGTITEVLARGADRTIAAFQQAPLYAGRWERFAGGWASLPSDLFCLGRALYSHVFSFKESFGYLLSGSHLDIRLHHFTGHGYFVRSDVLERVGGFRAPSCDTTLGYRLSLAGHRIALLAKRDVSEVPDTPRDLMRQGIVWFNGCELYRREYRDAKASGTLAPTPMRTAVRLAQVAFTNASWAFLPIVWSVWAGWCLWRGQAVDEWSVALFAWLLLRYLAWAHLLGASARCSIQLGVARTTLVPLVSPFVVLAGCVPPLVWYACRLVGIDVPLQKTPRGLSQRSGSSSAS